MDRFGRGVFNNYMKKQRSKSQDFMLGKERFIGKTKGFQSLLIMMAKVDIIFEHFLLFTELEFELGLDCQRQIVFLNFHRSAI